MADELRILHLVRVVGKRAFGVGPVVLGLAASQQREGHHVEVWSVDSADDVSGITIAHNLLPETIQTFPHVGPERLGYSPTMERTIRTRAEDFDIVHHHGFWTAITRVTNIWQEITHGPTIIAPHGTFDTWALRKSAWKKKLSLQLYGRKSLDHAACLHALSSREADAIRMFGVQKPIALIPNGISEDWLQKQGNRGRFLEKFKFSSDSYLFLSLGRITPKKGLPMFIHALHELRTELSNWRFVIAGVDEFGHEKEIRDLVDRLEMEKYIHFVGPLYGQDKLDAFAAANLFVLPSYSEGAPIVILEALGAGVPVLTTQASSWDDLHFYKCGWVTDISQEAIVETLKNVLHLDREELHRMGQRGKNLVAKQYTWEKIAKKTIALYTWLLDTNEIKPEFVRES